MTDEPGEKWEAVRRAAVTFEVVVYDTMQGSAPSACQRGRIAGQPCLEEPLAA